MPRNSSLYSILLASLVASTSPGWAATFDVTDGDWGDTTTVNSLAWAIHQSNITPGADLIRLFSDVNVDAAEPPPLKGGFLVDITDTAGLSIQGNGHSIVGNPFFNSGGIPIDKKFPQPYSSADNLFVSALSFAYVLPNVSHVNVDQLIVDGLNAFLDVHTNTIANITNSTFRYAVPWPYTPRAVFTADGSTINLTGVTFHNINRMDKPGFGDEFFFLPAIVGKDSNLNILKSKLEMYVTSNTAGAISWVGGIANVVSSTITGKGLSVSDSLTTQGVLNLVNSVVRLADDTTTARIQAYAGGVANIISSTLQFDASDSKIPNERLCPNFYPCNGAPLQVFAGGEINLQSSAISVLNDNITAIELPYSNSYDTQTGAPLLGVFQADPYSYVSPVTRQNGATLKTLFNQPSLITSGDAYALDPNSSSPNLTYYPLPNGAIPSGSGPLISVIPDADTLNALINPIDGSVITQDVYGNPRTFQGRRDIGAVQTQVPGPLPILGFGVAMGWSRRLRQRVRGQRG